MGGVCVISEPVNDEGILSVALGGDITFLECQSIRERLGKVVDTQDGLSIRIDLRDVSRIDSTGIALLIGLYKLVQGRVRTIVAAGSQPERIISRANVSMILNVQSHPTGVQTPSGVPHPTGVQTLTFEFASSSGDKMAEESPSQTTKSVDD